MAQTRDLSRRNLLHTVTGTALGMAAAGHARAETQDPPASGRKTSTGAANGEHLGEPYELAGRRIVFTNWYYVRPGSYGYYDAAGRNVRTDGSAGPLEVHLQGFDSPSGIRLAARPGQRTGPILQPQHPWENQGISLGTLIQDGGLFRAWGSGYYESADGIAWKRPELGLVEYHGSRRNNLLPGPTGTVFKDPSAPAAERYKGVYLQDARPASWEAYRSRRPGDWQCLALDADPGRIHAVHGAVSPDGIHWQTLPEPIVVEHSDTQIVACYDQRLRKYVMYTRNYPLGPRTRKIPYDGFRDQWAVGPRSIGRSETDDFRNFPVSEVILEPTPEMPPTDMLYTNCRTTVPGGPDHHLMFPAIWHRSDDTTSIGLLSSHNGKLWNYVPGSPVFETAEYGQWDGGCIFTHPNLVELPDGRWVLPYTGYNFPHKYPRGQLRYGWGYAAWPKGRLVGLEAPERGEFATVAFLPPGRKMRINALTRRAGRILVEVVGYHDGKPLPGRTFADAAPIIGDQHWTPVSWKGQEDLGHNSGTAIFLRFRMDKARIFGLEFA